MLSETGKTFAEFPRGTVLSSVHPWFNSTYIKWPVFIKRDMGRAHHKQGREKKIYTKL